MKLIRIAALAAFASLFAACSSSGSSPPAASSPQPNAQAANAYLATGSDWVNYLQWNTGGTGTFTDDTTTGTAPNEQVTSQQTPITATVNGSEVTFSGLQQDNGTLSNGTLTLQVLDPDGTLGTNIFNPATQDQFNKAVAALNTQVDNDNSAAIQQQQQASQESANAAAEQQAQKDLAAVQGISFTSDLGGLTRDVTAINNDLGTVKNDGGNGQGSECSNANTTEGDFDNLVGTAGSVGGDISSFTSDVSGARQAITTLQSDLSGLSSSKQPAPSGASGAISSAQGAISSAISTANGDISQVNTDVSDAGQVLSSLATGSCANIGIPYSPSPMPSIS